MSYSGQLDSSSALLVRQLIQVHIFLEAQHKTQLKWILFVQSQIVYELLPNVLVLG
jgi:hypothetical protein